MKLVWRHSPLPRGIPNVLQEPTRSGEVAFKTNLCMLNHLYILNHFPPIDFYSNFYLFIFKIWNASQICVASLRRGHANLLCIVPILVYVLPKRALRFLDILQMELTR